MQNTALNQLFAKEVQNRLFESNAFLEKFKNVSEYLHYRTVSMPNYTQASGTVSINSDTVDYNDLIQTVEEYVEFTVDVYRLKPVRIENFETLITSYDKFQLVLGEQANELADHMGKKILHKFITDVAPSKIYATTGTSGTGNGAGGANKKKFCFNDLIQLGANMNADNIPDDGNRWLIIDHVQNSELITDPQVLNQYQWGGTPVAGTGKVSQVAGFNIIVKPTIGTMNGTNGEINDLGIIPASADLRLALAFHTAIPLMANSEPMTYSATDVPQVYGSVFSMEQYMGCKNPRKDKKGVYLIKQG